MTRLNLLAWFAIGFGIGFALSHARHDDEVRALDRDLGRLEQRASQCEGEPDDEPTGVFVLQELR